MKDLSDGGLLSALPFPALLVDAAGFVIAANQAAEAELGAGLIGSPLSRAIGPSARLPGPDPNVRDAIARGTLDVTLEYAGRRVIVRSIPDAKSVAVAVVLDGPGDSERRSVAQARELASKVKHDVNNLLMGLLGHASLLQSRPELTEASRAKAVQIEEQGRKIRDSVAQLDAVRELLAD